MKFSIIATRTYYSSIEFTVEAESRNEAYEKAKKKIEDCEVEFDGIDEYEEDDEIEVYQFSNE